MNYKEYLKYRELNPDIRLVNPKSWSAYKCSKGGVKGALTFLKGPIAKSKGKVGIFKIKREYILRIQSEVKAGHDKAVIAKKYGVDVRSIYRYGKIKYGDKI